MKGQEINLKILGNGFIFVEIIRKFELRSAEFLEYPKDIQIAGGGCRDIRDGVNQDSQSEDSNPRFY